MTSRLYHLTKYPQNLNLLNWHKNCHYQLPGSSHLMLRVTTQQDPHRVVCSFQENSSWKRSIGRELIVCEKGALQGNFWDTNGQRPRKVQHPETLFWRCKNCHYHPVLVLVTTYCNIHVNGVKNEEE